MADYYSTLDGPDIDASLLDMAQHNSEAFAVGTRNGVEVSPSDETYHNNSKYWATVAGDMVEGTGIEDPNNDGNLIVNLPGGDSESWAVRTDTEQNLSEEQKAQARENIDAGSVNPNLLDNPWMYVNQRGSASYTSAGYTVDRWHNSNASAITSVAVGSTGVTLTKVSGGYAFFKQILGNPIDEEAMYTLSMMTADGTVYHASRKFVSGTSSETYVTVGTMSIGFGLYGKGATPYVAFYFGNSTVGSVTIRAVKLELGSSSTLAHDAPADYEVELRKCKYYFERISCPSSNALSIGYADAADTTYMYMPLKVSPKRTSPTASYYGTVKYGRGNLASAPSISSITTHQFDIASGYGTMKLAGSSLTVGNAYRVALDSGAHIDLSADL